MNIQDLNIETIVLLIGAAVAMIILVIWHLRNNSFDASQIITNADGTFSLSKFGQVVSMLVSTWVVIYQTRHGLMTEWLLTAYLLTWTGANGFTKYLESKKTGT